MDYERVLQILSWQQEAAFLNARQWEPGTNLETVKHFEDIAEALGIAIGCVEREELSNRY